MVRIQLLGGVQVTTARGEPVPVGSARSQVVLAALALAPGQAVPVPRLVELVWGEHPPDAAAKALQWHVVRLRKGLGSETIVRTGAAYRLDVDGDSIDVVRFRRHLDRGNVGAALETWTGVPLGGLDAPGLAAIIDGLVEQWLGAVEWDLAQRVETDPNAAVARLTELCASHPLREGLWATLMTALYRVGRQADALAAYRKARHRLVEELGVEPGPRLRDLEASILAHDARLGAYDQHRHQRDDGGQPSIGAGQRNRGNLPQVVDPLIGRDEAVRAVVAELARSPVVTLVGPGGVGKTRLALAVARATNAERGLAAWLVELAEVTDSCDVPRLVADVLGVTEAPGRPLIDAICAAARTGLLILDNCEHLLDGAAAVAQVVAASGGDGRVLATSRERLAIASEQVLAVEPLEPAGPGVELFRTRALAADPTLDLAGRLGDVTEICRRLDGMPLAIELAAARAKSLSLPDLKARLDDCLPLLAGGRRTAPERQRTLKATIQWSYDLLDAGERALLRQLSIFVGPFDLAAAEDVTGGAGSDRREIANCLAGLVERSMVVVEPEPSSRHLGHTREPEPARRYRLLETVRQFAVGLRPEDGEPDRLAESYARWCSERVAAIGAQLAGPAEACGMQRLADLWPDLRSAVAWACSVRDPELAMALVRPIATELPIRARHEIGDFAERILAITAERDVAARGFWLLWISERYTQGGNPAAYDQIVDLHGEPDHPFARYARANVSGDGETLRQCLADVVTELVAGGDGYLARFIQLMSAGSLLGLGRFSEVDALVTALVEHYRRQGPPSILHWALQTLGYSASFQQRTGAAERFFDDAATVDVPDGTLSANAPVAARSAFRRGERDRAADILRSYIDELLEAGNVVAASVVCIEFINMMAASGRYVEAACMLRYLERANEFGALAAKTLVAQAARAVAANAELIPGGAAGRGWDDRRALVYMRDALSFD